MGVVRVVLAAAALQLAAGQGERERNEQFWEAAKSGNAETVRQLLTDGVEVDAKTKYGATALSFACDRGHLEIVRMLLDAGADINAEDKFYNAPPLGWAVSNGHVEVVELLLKRGANGADDALRSGAAMGNTEIVQAVLKHAEVEADVMRSALATARARGHEKVVEVLKKHAPPEEQGGKIDAEQLKRYAGVYQQEDGGSLTIELEEGQLRTSFGTAKFALVAEGEHQFDLAGSKLEFQLEGDEIVGMKMTRGESTSDYRRATANEAPDKPRRTGDSSEPAAEQRWPELAISGVHWPSFRGAGARGVADGQRAPAQWDVPAGVNVRWKTPIDGLGHSSPVVWEDRVFVTTAVSSAGKSEVRTGLYGDVNSVEDDSPHEWQVICLDKFTGDVLWRHTARQGAPRVRRHLKSSHANPTPATDGRYVVASFGGEGLYCYDLHGQPRWSVDLGELDSGWFYDSGYQWGFASSPVIFRGMVFVQCDVQKNSFVAAYDLATGDQVWRTDRDEIPSWGTPTICQFGDTAQLVTNATGFVRGYDALSGEELWRLSGNSEITVPTPFTARGLIYVASGYRPVQPIYAIRPDATGDITLEDDEETNAHVAWSNRREGPYMPTPIVYGDYLYTCGNDGVVRCHDAKTGERLYRQRLGESGRASFAAAPIAADGRLYFTAEDGHVYVVRAGRKFELLHTNPVGQFCFATPAISEGLFLIRTVEQLIAVGNSRGEP